MRKLSAASAAISAVAISAAIFILLLLCCTVNAQTVFGGPIGGSTNGFPLQAGSSVLTPAVLNSYRVMFGNVGRTAPPQLMAIFGDSTCVGVGIGTGGTSNLNGAQARSWPVQLAAELTALGYPAQINSVFAEGNISSSVSYNAYDPRVTLGASFVTNSLAIPGGFAFTNTGGTPGAATTFSFTPSNSIDSFYVFWGQRGGTANVNIDGGASLTVTSGLGAGGTLVTIPGSFASFANAQSFFSVGAGAHTINVVFQSGTTNDVMGVRAYLSTAKYLDIMPVCQSGAKISSFDNPTATFRDGKYFASYVPNIAMLDINLTVNDIASSTTGAAYTASLTDMKTFNPVPWMFMYGPYISAMGNPISGNSIVSAISTFAATNNYPTIDFSSRWIGGATNLTGGDNVHPTYAGASDIARFTAFLMSQM
jgi:lysophospholipase L1-like esterase